jgi:hypothetical protein
MANAPTSQGGCIGVPMPIVKLNRWVLALGTLSALVLRQPLITTALFLVLLSATLLGQRGSLIFQIGKRVFASRLATAEWEDWRLQRFNNAIATMLLGLAQVAFLLGHATLGWVFTLVVTAAASAALAGFCLGCFLYYQFRLNRYRLFGA